MSDSSDDDFKLFISKRFNKRRKELFSQTRLAAIMGVGFQQIQKYENGENWISTATMVILARVLGVFTNYFYTSNDTLTLPENVKVEEIYTKFTAAEHELLGRRKELTQDNRKQLMKSIRVRVEKNINAHIGDRMKKRRKALGLSQKDLGEPVGITWQQVHKYESGRDRARLGRLQKCANTLQVPVEYFFEDLDCGPLPNDVRREFDLIERALVMNFRYLTDGQKEDVLTAVRNLQPIVWRRPVSNMHS